MTPHLIVLGTDTDAGKTTFSLLWLAAFADRYEYWKPLETGESDSETVRRLVPGATVHAPLGRFRDPVAPPLAARREGRNIPLAAEIAHAIPTLTTPNRTLLIETFGGPLSPLNETELQIEWVRRAGGACVLVASSAVGAVGRTLSALDAMAGYGVVPAAVVLVGDWDEYAEAEIAKHRPGASVVGVSPPAKWSAAGLHETAREQWNRLDELEAIVRRGVRPHPPSPSPKRRGGAEPFFPPSPFRGGVGGGVETPATDPLPTDPDALLAADARFVWHPYSSLRPAAPPLPVVGADREFLALADGTQLIDAVSSWWTILHGHRFPPLVAALKAAVERIDHVLFAGVTHPDAVRFAERIVRTVDWMPGGRVFFSDDGSTAVEVALKMAYQFWCHRGEPHRKRFVGFEKAYHGDTFGAMAVGRDRLFFGHFEPLLFDAVQLPLDPNRLDEFLAKQGSEVAAVIVEPLLQAAGGMATHSPKTLAQLFDAAKRHGVLFIADEVATGCRTGARWAHRHAGIAPDLIAAAKTLAGGLLPLAVTLAAPGIVDAFDTADRSRSFFHGHSFTAHPLACALAAVNEELIARPGVLERGAEIGRILMNELEPLRGRPGITDVRACGSVAAVETMAAGGYLAGEAERWKAVAQNRGVFLRPLGNVLYAMPPLGTTDESLHRIADAIRAAVSGTVS